MRRVALILALTAIAACASPPKPDTDPTGNAATSKGWSASGMFQ
jgi:hypothetical protein